MNDFSDEIFSFGEDKLPLFFRVYYLESGFNNDEINIIKTIAEQYSPDEGKLLNLAGDNYSNPTIRVSSVKRLNNSDAELAWVVDRLMRIAVEANNALRWNFSIIGFYEKLQFATYDSNQAGHYAQHYDLGPGVGNFRKISVSVQLSDESDYEGGELEVHGFNAAPKKKGGVIVFPSFLMHRVAPVTKGVRESLVGWVAGPPFK